MTDANGDRGELCLSCALCCDGSLFGIVRLDEPLEPRVKVRLAIVTFGTEEVIEQPCPALDGARCDIYEDRPGRCRAFECEMLKAYKRDELSREECLDRISRVRTFIDQEEQGDRSKDARGLARYRLALEGARKLIDWPQQGESS